MRLLPALTKRGSRQKGFCFRVKRKAGINISRSRGGKTRYSKHVPSGQLTVHVPRERRMDFPFEGNPGFLQNSSYQFLQMKKFHESSPGSTHVRVMSSHCVAAFLKTLFKKNITAVKRVKDNFLHLRNSTFCFFYCRDNKQIYENCKIFGCFSCWIQEWTAGRFVEDLFIWLKMFSALWPSDLSDLSEIQPHWRVKKTFESFSSAQFEFTSFLTINTVLRICLIK